MSIVVIVLPKIYKTKHQLHGSLSMEKKNGAMSMRGMDLLFILSSIMMHTVHVTDRNLADVLYRDDSVRTRCRDVNQSLRMNRTVLI